MTGLSRRIEKGRLSVYLLQKDILGAERYIYDSRLILNLRNVVH